MKTPCYIAIDLKSFYASVECRERGLDPLTTHLVVADPTRTDKTICLAVTPALKAHGLPGRPRLFEVVQRVAAVNAERRAKVRGHRLTGRALDAAELAAPTRALDYIIAPPQMAKYMEVSAAIYKCYLRYIAAEDIHIYSIDEVFMDVSRYLDSYACTAHELALRIIRTVLEETGITATAGIGTNLYLAKIAMDIVAKHLPADADGVRIAELDEMSYREQLWEHRPLRDFWRVGRGYVKTLEANGLFTMGDIALRSLQNENSLYRLFGKNAELLIDHAWGWEPCTIADIKAYRPAAHSLGSGQVLSEPTPADTGRLIVREMADLLALSLVDKGLVTEQVVLSVGYDVECLTLPDLARLYRGPICTDSYGRRVPKPAHGSLRLAAPTSSARELTAALMQIYDSEVNPQLLLRRVTVSATGVRPESEMNRPAAPQQLDLFTDYEALHREQEQTAAERKREHAAQQAVLSIKKRFGKNAILKGMNFQQGGKTIERNGQIGGHKA